uniref:Uncharacterized protein n=1 Tax=viral metagenome TaxID=1070528 RepID=A0A6M3LKG4_9ZZZZ
MDFELVMNKAIDKLSLLTKEDFHGYRSEIWAVLAEVYREGQQTDSVDTRRCLLWSGCQLKLTEGGCLTGCVKRQ